MVQREEGTTVLLVKDGEIIEINISLFAAS